MTRTSIAVLRLAEAWRRSHEPVPGVGPWIRRAALAIPLVVLPSCVWRIFTVWFVTGDEARGAVPPWLPMGWYVLTISMISELAAFASVGLIARWGEVWPRWMLGLAHRRIPIAVPVVPALFAGAGLTVVTALAAVSAFRGLRVDGAALPDDFPLHFESLSGVISVGAYVPLLLWGPLLCVVTMAYWRRRA